MKKTRKIHLLLAILLLIFNSAFAQKRSITDIDIQQPARIIEADMNEIKGETKKVWRKSVGAGRANEGLRADWQEQLVITKKECGFEYIRMHGLLHDDMGVYSEDRNGNPVYNWQYIDKLYDFLLSINIKPFVELSFMPKALASGEQTVFWWKANVTPPKSYDKWHDLIKALTEHFTERYGKEEVREWYFEIWNEPNHRGFFSGSIDDYLKMYEYAAKAIKAVDTEYRVGGPATAGNAWVNEIIDFCSTNSVPIDFITTHTYGVGKGFLDEFGVKGTVLKSNPNAITADVSNVRNQINQSIMPHLELHYTEWSASYTPSDPIHDSYHSSAYILDKLKGTEDVANSMSYWVFTDVFEEPGPRVTPFHGGFGLMNYQSIKKPAYYTYQYLNRLGDIEIENADPAAWVCKNENGDIQTLFWDFTLTFPNDSVNNQVYYRRNLPSKDKGITQVKLNNVAEGKYLLKISKVGYQSNDAYATYLKLGKPSQLTRREVQTIKDCNNGDPFITEVITIGTGKSFTHHVNMRENDLFLIELIKL